VGGDRLYDIAADRGESTNVAADHPDVVKRLAASYEQFWASLPSEKDTLPRHIIGANATRLNGMDWYQGASPWNKGAFRGKSSGVWAVEVQKSGKYRFELRHYPREANKPHGATDAAVRVGQTEVAVNVTDPNQAVVEVDLKPGFYDLAATFGGGKKKSWGALFVYVSRVGD